MFHRFLGGSGVQVRLTDFPVLFSRVCGGVSITEFLVYFLIPAQITAECDK